jgi:hypothetical protein
MLPSGQLVPGPSAELNRGRVELPFKNWPAGATSIVAFATAIVAFVNKIEAAPTEHALKVAFGWIAVVYAGGCGIGYLIALILRLGQARN